MLTLISIDNPSVLGMKVYGLQIAIVYFLSILIVFTSCKYDVILPPLPCMSAPIDLVSWWPGDEDAKDVVSDNDGTLQNGTTLVPGIVGQAFSFDGVDDFVDATTNNLPTGNSDRTLEMWVKINSFVANEAFFAGYGTFGSGNQTYHLGTTQSGNLFFSSWGPAIFGPELNTGVWYHVAVTNVSNLVTLYLDGESVTNGTQNININTSSSTQFFVGRISGSFGDSRRLNGFVDEVSIYNRALSDSEIQAIFNADIRGKCG